MNKEKKQILKSKKFKCKNKPLIAWKYNATGGYQSGREVWLIEEDKGQKRPNDKYYLDSNDKYYLDSVDNGHFDGGTKDEFYSLDFCELNSFTEYIGHWRKSYILPNFRGYGIFRGDGKKGSIMYSYTVDTYDISKKEFDEMLKNMKMLMDNGFIVEYNDEHGVGNFRKKGQKYLATHWRYSTLTEETLSIEKIGEFLRDFLDIGINYVKEDTWN